MGKFLSDFKEFALKGNVIDMAVGVIVGGAFGKIVSSLVNDLLMPVITLITGNPGYANLKYVVKAGVPAGPDGTGAIEEVAINYGLFIQNIVDFFIIAISIFVALRLAMKLKKKEEEPAPEAAPEPTKEEVLLTEIRDILKSEQKK